MIPMEAVGTEFLAIILSGGAAAMIAAIVQAYRSLKDGSRSEDRDAFAEIETARKSEAKRRTRAEIERDYWHRRAAVLEFTCLSQLGREAVPAPEPWPEHDDEDD